MNCPEDRLITALQSIKLKVIDLGVEIDKQQAYIEKCKKVRLENTPNKS